MLGGYGGNGDGGKDGGKDGNKRRERDQEDYPDYGPVYLSATSKAMMLDWYRKAKNIRKEKRNSRNDKKGMNAMYKEKIIKDISDDEVSTVSSFDYLFFFISFL